MQIFRAFFKLCEPADGCAARVKELVVDFEQHAAI
jgi:hypothetical protein